MKMRYNWSDQSRFGGNRTVALERDGYSCVKCGITEKDHKAKWGYSLTVDHIDGNGRGSSNPNNSLLNMQTLCIPCHTEKSNEDRFKKGVCRKGHDLTTGDFDIMTNCRGVYRRCRKCFGEIKIKLLNNPLRVKPFKARRSKLNKLLQCV